MRLRAIAGDIGADFIVDDFRNDAVLAGRRFKSLIAAAE